VDEFIKVDVDSYAESRARAYGGVILPTLRAMQVGDQWQVPEDQLFASVKSSCSMLKKTGRRYLCERKLRRVTRLRDA
jgi:hypothetical protein